MKTIQRICILSMLSLLWACFEDVERKPAFQDGSAPSPVSEVVVQNQPGGAIITYGLPTDADIIGVEARFKRGDQLINKSTSIYSNKIVIEGLKSLQKVDIEIRTFDRSNNFSTPVAVSAVPLKSPIDEIFESFGLVETFGGVRLTYDNKHQVQVEFQLLKKEKAGGRYKYSQSAFVETNKRTGFNFRGFKPETEDFGVVAIDRWNNISDTLYARLTPISEQELDRLKFKKVSPEIPNDSKIAFGWELTNLWNGSNEGSGYHTGQLDPGVIIKPYVEPFHVFTMDLGVTANISRLRFWQRQGNDYIYAHGNPRNFEVWGIDKIPANYDGGSLEGWTRLVENGEVVKPSGAPIKQNSAADQAAALAGEEFETLDPTKPIRYVRFVNKKNWVGAKFMHLVEVKFWGKVLP